MAEERGLMITRATADKIAELWHAYKTAGGIRHKRHRRRWPITPGVDLQLGKVKDTTIASRASGLVELWGGDPGAETDQDTDGTYTNMCPQTLTKDKWVCIVGAYIVQVINPARFIEVTLTADLIAAGTSASPTVANFWDGDDPANLPSNLTPLTIYASSVQTQTIKSGAKVIATWDDVRQRYNAVDWTCP